MVDFSNAQDFSKTLASLIQEERQMGKNRAAAYKTTTFEEIDSSLLTLSESSERMNKLKNVAESLYKDNQDCIVLLYILGKLKLINRPHESNVALSNLLMDFYSASNWAMAEHIALSLIENGNSNKALRVMGDVAGEKGDEKAKWEYFEHYAKADAKDIDIVIKVADHAENNGDKKLASAYYQRALSRLAKTEENSKIYDVYSKYIANGKGDFQYFLSYAEGFKENRPKVAIELLKLLLESLSKLAVALKSSAAKPAQIRQNLDDQITAIRAALNIDKDDPALKGELCTTLEKRYGDTQRFKAVFKKYNIQNSNDPVSALDSFIRDIAYAEKAYIITKNNPIKVGIITKIANDIVTVKFSATDIKETTLSAATTSYNVITTQHIKAIKKGVPAEKIKEKIIGPGGIEWLVKTLLYSARDNTSTLKDMKSEVVPSILSEAEWKKKSEEIKRELKTNPYISIIPGPSDKYILCTNPSTQEEKALAIYKNSKGGIDKKVEAFIQAIDDQDVDNESDAISEMVSDFIGYSNDENRRIDERITALLMLDYASRKSVNIDSELGFDDLYSLLLNDDKVVVFNRLSNSVIKRQYIDKVIAYDSDAFDVLVAILPNYLNQYIPLKLQKKFKSRFTDYLERVFISYKDNIPVFVYFATDFKFDDEALQKANITRVGFFKTKLMAFAYLKNNKIGDGKNFNLLRKDLIENSGIENFLRSASKEELEEVKLNIFANVALDNVEKDRYLSLILKRFPDFSVNTASSKPAAPQIYVPKAIQGFLTTRTSYEKKKAELKQIQEVDIPANLKDIQTARELGDLRENSEYQYAKDHKRELDRRVSELNRDLNSVRVMKMSDVLPQTVGFGTMVSIHDNKNDKELTYTFLGRWESDPENNIIDLNAPIGQSLINHKPNERLNFTINDREYDWTITRIEEIQFD